MVSKTTRCWFESSLPCQPDELKGSEKVDKVKLYDSLKEFFADAKAEFKKISWPSRDEVKESTVIVSATILFVMLVLGVYDLGIMGVANFAGKLFSK